MHSSGKESLKRPWENPDIYVNASGDDVVVWCAPHLAQDIHDAILAKTSRTRDALKKDGEPNVVGLG